MRQLQTRHILLFRTLRDHCSFLTRQQIQRVLTLSKIGTTKQLQWLLAERYLNRRYRADTFKNYQTPVYYLGPLGWRVVGKPAEDYRRYRLHIERRFERTFDHSLLVFDVFLKFLLDTEVKRLIEGENEFWQQTIDLGNIPDGWIQYKDGAGFIEVDRGTENPIVLRKKFENYVRFSKSGGYRQLFPDCSFKVLVFTTTEGRIKTLEAIVDQFVHSDDIWFCTMPEFMRETLEHEHWFTLSGIYALLATPKKEV